MAPFDAELCAAIHRRLDEKAEQNANNIERLFSMYNKLLWTIITVMGIILMAVFGVLWTQVQMRGDMQTSSMMAQYGARQAHADAGGAHDNAMRHNKETDNY